MIQIFDARIFARISIFLFFVLLPSAQATTFKILYTFSGGVDGCYPSSGSLIVDSHKDLYGTTAGEVCSSFGTVFKLTSDGNKTLLYTFPGGSGGAEPESLVADKNGNLWGTTIAGGIGGGVIFKIDSMDHEDLIHTFQGSPSDGCVAQGAMVVGASGNFYGTTFGCGKHDYGAVFKLASDGTESLIYSFRGGRDGFFPFATLTVDAKDNLYGTTDYGGKVNVCPEDFGGCGTIFELAPDGTKTPIYKFKGPRKDGETVMSNVIMDNSGNFYGTTNGGGRAGCFSNQGCGIVFKLAPDHTETVLHYFTGEGSDGANPPAGLIADDAGNLYGATEFGGGHAPCNGADGCGTIFKIAPGGTETILHKFKEATDGANPIAGLVADGAGNLYGTAEDGGAFGYGTVFEITP